MLRDTKSERSRRLVLDAALELFSGNGYGQTSVREIADRAGLSTGNLYHHFPDKEAIFRTLLDEYRAIVASERFPFSRAMRSGSFPDNIEQLGYAARESVQQYRAYMALVYVDVIEFNGTHIRDFYTNLAHAFDDFAANDPEGAAIALRLRPGVSVSSALQMVTRIFFNYFQLEILFGVREPFGKDSNAVVREIADMLRAGIVAAPE